MTTTATTVTTQGLTIEVERTAAPFGDVIVIKGQAGKFCRVTVHINRATEAARLIHQLRSYTEAEFEAGYPELWTLVNDVLASL